MMRMFSMWCFAQLYYCALGLLRRVGATRGSRVANSAALLRARSGGMGALSGSSRGRVAGGTSCSLACRHRAWHRAPTLEPAARSAVDARRPEAVDLLEMLLLWLGCLVKPSA